ncbi:hypothetical protein DFH07DRAFT_71699 [Mycena maculata]|uniref:Uncharacterized protein n=1 Tax=Mycena maculata TaxID=230809 RepID=A0AAD7ICG2_9AGAR|nr:hypothetical protein DFH07DRAFT_71699 [Mycena maculata]
MLSRSLHSFSPLRWHPLLWTRFIRKPRPASRFSCSGKTERHHGLCIVSDGNTLEILKEETTDTSFHWTVNVEAGTVVVPRLTDSTGAVANSSSFTIQPGLTNCTLDNAAAATTQPDPPQNAQTTAQTIAQTTAKVTTTTSSSTTTTQQTATTPSTPLPPTSSSSTPLPSGSTSNNSPTVVSVSASPASTSSASNPSPEASGNILPTAATIGAQPSSAATSASATLSTKRTISGGAIAAIVITILIFLVILGLWLVRRHRRRLQSPSNSNRGGFIDLEAQSSPPRWFQRPGYQFTWFNRGSPEPDAPEPPPKDAVAPESRPRPSVAPISTLPPEGLLTPSSSQVAGHAATVASPSLPISALSPYPKSSAETSDVGALQTRIDTLMEENAILADLATRPVGSESPPPAYA